MWILARDGRFSFVPVDAEPVTDPFPNVAYAVVEPVPVGAECIRGASAGEAISSGVMLRKLPLPHVAVVLAFGG